MQISSILTSLFLPRPFFSDLTLSVPVISSLSDLYPQVTILSSVSFPWVTLPLFKHTTDYVTCKHSSI